MLVSPPKILFFKTTLSLSFSPVFSCVFHFDFAFYVHQPLLRYYSRFVSLALSLLPLSFVRFCFVPSNQFRSIPFSNPPCFHFRSFRSSILPLCTLVFSGLAFPSFLFVLVFVWLLSPFFHHWKLYSWFLFLLFLVVQVWRRLFWFQPKALFSKPLSVCHSLLLLFLFLFSISTFQGFFFMSPIFELTLSFCFSGVLFLAPLHSSFLIRSFHPVGSHLLLQSTLLLFLVVLALLFFLSYHSFFFRHGCLFLPFFSLVGFGLGCFSLLLFPFFLSLGFFCLVSLSGVFGGPTLSKLDIFLVGVIEVINAKRGFFLRKEREKKTSQTTGRRGLLN